jgi:hypothetical protein
VHILNSNSSSESSDPPFGGAWTRPIAADVKLDYFALLLGALASAERVGTLLLAQVQPRSAGVRRSANRALHRELSG